MWTDGIQAYYSCIVSLVIFFIVVVVNRVVSKRIRRIFYFQIILILFCIIITWVDYVFESEKVGSFDKSLARTITLSVNYALFPLVAILFALVYIKHLNTKTKIFLAIPFLVNLILIIVNIFSGILFRVDENGVDSHGELFFIPFVVCLVYMVCLIYFNFAEKENKNKSYEIAIQVANTIIITGSFVLELVFNLNFLLWPTIFMASIFYYVELSLQSILQDNLTGAMSEVAFEYFININKGHTGTISLIDINDLSYINAKYGKDVGDSVLVACVSSILKTKLHRMYLYRMKEDQFILVARDQNIEDVNDILEKSKENIGEVNGVKASFAYGTAIFHENDRLEEKIKDATKIMEINKTHVKKIDIRQ